MKTKGAKSKEAFKLVEYISETYQTLPFASRWIHKTWQGDASAAFEELVASACVVGYPVLVEASGNVVAQAEHTIVGYEEWVRVLTA